MQHQAQCETLMSSHCLVLLKKAPISSTLQLTSQVRRMFFVQQLRTATPFIHNNDDDDDDDDDGSRTNKQDRHTDRQTEKRSKQHPGDEGRRRRYQGNTQAKTTGKQHNKLWQTCRFARVRTLYVHQHHHSTPVTWGGHRTNVQAQTTNNERHDDDHNDDHNDDDDDDVQKVYDVGLTD